MRTFLISLWLVASAGTAGGTLIWSTYSRLSSPQGTVSPIAAPVFYGIAVLSTLAALVFLIASEDSTPSNHSAK